MLFPANNTAFALHGENIPLGLHCFRLVKTAKKPLKIALLRPNWVERESLMTTRKIYRYQYFINKLIIIIPSKWRNVGKKQ